MHGVMRGVVDGIAFPLACRHDKDEELMVTHLADQTVPGSTQLDLGAITRATPSARGDPGLSQPLGQLVS
jgi:hypothetical protein